MICSATQWTGFFMITASVMKELKVFTVIPFSYLLPIFTEKTFFITALSSPFFLKREGITTLGWKKYRSKKFLKVHMIQTGHFFLFNSLLLASFIFLHMLFLCQMIPYITCYHPQFLLLLVLWQLVSFKVDEITLVSKLFPWNQSSYLLNLLLNIKRQEGTSRYPRKMYYLNYQQIKLMITALI